MNDVKTNDYNNPKINKYFCINVWRKLMPVIFVDEAGYTGENLLDANQPVFALSSLCLPEEECQELKDKYFGEIKATEIKYSLVKRNPLQQQALLDFLNDIRNRAEAVKLVIVNKKYAVLTKIVDLIVEPAMRREGLDLYDRGGNIAFSNLLYHILPVMEGKEFFDKVLNLFQKMMRSRRLYDYVVFYGTVLGHKYKHSDSEQVFKFAMLGGYRDVGLQILNSPKRTLDLAVTSALTLMALWRKDIKDGSGITLIHDRSSQMAGQRHIWDALVDPKISAQEVGYDVRTYSFPIAVTETYAEEDSKDWAGLQLADLIAGAAAEFANWLLSGESKDESFAFEINRILNSGDFYIHQTWATDNITPESLGTTGGNVFPFDKFEEIISKQTS